jgi:hypothetical protein
MILLRAILTCDCRQSFARIPIPRKSVPPAEADVDGVDVAAASPGLRTHGEAACERDRAAAAAAGAAAGATGAAEMAAAATGVLLGVLEPILRPAKSDVACA